MRSVDTPEDVHFYIDNAPPDEVAWVLRALSRSEALTTQAIAEKLQKGYGFRMQRDRTYSPRRLYDLGLAEQVGGRAALKYTLTGFGLAVQNLLALDQALYGDLMHFLHYSGHNGQPHTRKYLWSYRKCCEVIWAEGYPLPTQQLAARVQGLMKDEFPQLDFGARQGARFDSTAAGRFYTWIGQLSPSPLPQQGDGRLYRRSVQRFELALLSLDHVYRARGYRYGDPVVLDDQLLDELARVFFLEHTCYSELLSLATAITRHVTLTDTFAGTSVALLAPYGVEDI